MEYQMTPRQRAWFDAAGPDNRRLFLARGPAMVPNLMNFTTNKMVYRPAVRGCIMSDDTFPTYAEALEAAEEHLAKIRAEVGSATLDERALGWDDSYRDFGDMLEEHTLRVDWIVPLFGMTEIPDLIDEWLEDIGDDEVKRLAPQMPAFARMFDRNDSGDEEGEEGEDEDDPREMERWERQDLFIEAITNDRLMGMLVQISQPVPTERMGDTGTGYSWSYTRRSTLYADTLEGAIAAAAEWGKATWNEARAKLPDRENVS